MVNEPNAYEKRKGICEAVLVFNRGYSARAVDETSSSFKDTFKCSSIEDWRPVSDDGEINPEPASMEEALAGILTVDGPSSSALPLPISPPPPARPAKSVPTSADALDLAQKLLGAHADGFDEAAKVASVDVYEGGSDDANQASKAAELAERVEVFEAANVAEADGGAAAPVDDGAVDDDVVLVTRRTKKARVEKKTRQ